MFVKFKDFRFLYLLNYSFFFLLGFIFRVFLMEQLIYKTDEFEGPLDLMLKLIAKNKLDICNIEISSLLEQYLVQLDLLRQQNLEISSSFLEMAAKLVYIKTAQLLPKYEEEARTLKEEITSQLLEYNEYKKVSEILLNNLNFDLFCRKPMKIDLDLTYKGIHSIAEIGRTYIDIIDSILSKNLKLLEEREDNLQKIVTKKPVSVFSKVLYILKCLYKKGEFVFEDLFFKKEEKSELIAFFLAVLELIKCNKVLIAHESNKIVPSENCVFKSKKMRKNVLV